MRKDTTKNKHHLLYRNLNSALRPISHRDQIPAPTFTHLSELEEEGFLSSSDLSNRKEDEDFYYASCLSGKSMLFNQLELNDLVRDLYLPKQSAE